MRTLNRPMFRYGGPIKEGVMNGIREPKRNGGSMGINTPKRGLVDGPGSYAGFIPPLIAAGSAAMRFIPSVYRGIKAGKYVKGFRPTANFRQPATPSGQVISGKYKPSPLSTREMLTSPEIYGRAIKENPGTAITLASLAGSGANKLFNNEPENKNKNNKTNSFGGGKRLVGTSGSPGGGDPGAYLEPRVPEKEELTAEQIKAAENKLRREQMDTYREIMDIKGMNKDAAYKSLIDASKIIQEGGNLKKQIKDGSLIANITQAASKRFDKVGDTEAALRSLIAKGEITKEMNKDENALAKLLKQKQIEIADKSLAGKSMAEIISTRMEKGDMFQGTELASLLRVKKGIDAKVLPSSGMEQGQDPLDFIVSQVAAVNADETTPDYPEGVYVIKDRIIQVIDGQVVPVSINQLT